MAARNSNVHGPYRVRGRFRSSRSTLQETYKRTRACWFCHPKTNRRGCRFRHAWCVSISCIGLHQIISGQDPFVGRRQNDCIHSAFTSGEKKKIASPTSHDFALAGFTLRSSVRMPSWAGLEKFSDFFSKKLRFFK